MAGSTCEILLETNDGPTLDAIDAVLATMAEQLHRTRKGRVWDVWVRGRPVHVEVFDSRPAASLSAGLNSPEDYALLREIAERIVAAVGGIYSEPGK